MPIERFLYSATRRCAYPIWENSLDTWPKARKKSMNETFLKVIYLVAISLATAGWLWLLAQCAIALLDL